MTLDLFSHLPSTSTIIDPSEGGDVRLQKGFVPEPAATNLLARLTNSIPWESRVLNFAGRTVPQPRLVCWVGDAGKSYSYSGLRFHPHPWPAWMGTLRKRVEEAAGEEFNSVLLNLYRTGADSISYHSDDEPELGPAPIIASVSLGAERIFSLQPRPQPRAGNGKRPRSKTIEVALPHGSLLIMRGATQSGWLHSVRKTDVPTADSSTVGQRIALHLSSESQDCEQVIAGP